MTQMETQGQGKGGRGGLDVDDVRVSVSFSVFSSASNQIMSNAAISKNKKKKTTTTKYFGTNSWESFEGAHTK